MASGGDRPGFDRVSGNAADAQGPEQLARGRHGAIDVNTPTSVLDHDRLEPFAMRIFRRIAHAEIEREAGEEDPPQAAFAQVAGTPGTGVAVVFEERRIGIDLAVISLA